MKDTQGDKALNGQTEAEVEVEVERTKEKKVGVLTRRAHPPETQDLKVGQLMTTKKELEPMSQ